MRRSAEETCILQGTPAEPAPSPLFLMKACARNFSSLGPTLAASDATNQMLAALTTPNADARRDSFVGLR